MVSLRAGRPPFGDDRIIRVAELFTAPFEHVEHALRVVLPPDVTGRANPTRAGVYVTVERRLSDPPALRRSRAIRYLEGLVDEVGRELESRQSRPERFSPKGRAC